LSKWRKRIARNHDKKPNEDVPNRGAPNRYMVWKVIAVAGAQPVLDSSW
jgi:hypothetical protein